MQAARGTQVCHFQDLVHGLVKGQTYEPAGYQAHEPNR